MNLFLTWEALELVPVSFLRHIIENLVHMQFNLLKEKKRTCPKQGRFLQAIERRKRKSFVKLPFCDRKCQLI